MVIENHEISRGFHGVVRAGALEERDVVTNVPRLRMKSVLWKFTLDSLILHLHIQGDYAVTSDGMPRLVPARMPEIAGAAIPEAHGLDLCRALAAGSRHAVRQVGFSVRDLDVYIGDDDICASDIFRP